MALILAPRQVLRASPNLCLGQPLTHPRRFTKTCSLANNTAPALKPVAPDTDFDARIIGAGAGGVTAASLLAKKGYRTLMVEAKERLGGRASTLAKTYSDIGLSLSLYEPERASTVLRFGGRHVNLSEGFVGLLRNIIPAAVASGSGMLPFLRPKKGESTRSWLNRLTSSPTIHNIIDNVLGSMFAARGDVVPAEVLLYYFSKDTSFKKIGLAKGGTIEIWKPLAHYVQNNGGQVWFNSIVSELTFSPDGLVTGALIQREDGSQAQVSSKLTVSNIGPLGTAQLAGLDQLPRGYVDGIERWNNPAAIITVHVASQEPLASFPFLAIMGNARRMAYAGNFSAPELRCSRGMVPVLWCFRPHSCKRILAIDVTAHDWPAQRAVSGFDEPQTTPVPNLFNVGDGVKPWASGGTAACAQSARNVVEKIVKIYPL
ncbi:pseudooxynicotine oxidase [Fusarium albosuccineum]|uniref:Pseudooxynicotine oxidase n=1 Tax=Fusarium albosuccineum TaxID=1237068 RepID=A0A8H4P3A7_9HYPO|nr:pseudooxynicotine oxidase [Fusarium albosuccineum]